MREPTPKMRAAWERYEHGKERFSFTPCLEVAFFDGWRAALATGARSAETRSKAQSEGRQSGGEAVTPNPYPGADQ